MLKQSASNSFFCTLRRVEVIALARKRLARAQSKIRYWENKWQTRESERFKNKTIPKSLFILIVGAGINTGFAITALITLEATKANGSLLYILAVLGFLSIVGGYALTRLFHLWMISGTGFLLVSVGVGFLLGPLSSLVTIIESGVQVASAVMIIITGVWISGFLKPGLMEGRGVYFIYALALLLSLPVSPQVAHAFDGNASSPAVLDWFVVVGTSFTLTNYLQNTLIEGPITLDGAFDALTHLYINIANTLYRKRFVIILNQKKDKESHIDEDYSI